MTKIRQILEGCLLREEEGNSIGWISWSLSLFFKCLLAGRQAYYVPSWMIKVQQNILHPSSLKNQKTRVWGNSAALKWGGNSRDSQKRGTLSSVDNLCQISGWPLNNTCVGQTQAVLLRPKKPNWNLSCCPRDRVSEYKPVKFLLKQKHQHCQNAVSTT